MTKSNNSGIFNKFLIAFVNVSRYELKLWGLGALVLANIESVAEV
jgi:hypothetical protein